MTAHINVNKMTRKLYNSIESILSNYINAY